MFRNVYDCPTCGTHWHDQSDTTCDDRCPTCATSCSPTESEDIDDDRPVVVIVGDRKAEEMMLSDAVAAHGLDDDDIRAALNRGEVFRDGSVTIRAPLAYVVTDDDGRAIASDLSLADAGRIVAERAGRTVTTDAEAEAIACDDDLGDSVGLYVLTTAEHAYNADRTDIWPDEMVAVSDGESAPSYFMLSALVSADDGLREEAGAIRAALRDGRAYRTGGGAAPIVDIRRAED